jgi:hypothetical protein
MFITLPIYLGVAKEGVDQSSSYWFFAVKEGVGRFLVYKAYFFWAKEVPPVIELNIPLPDVINEELGLFLSGKIEYEWIKKRRNSTHTTVIRHYLETKEDDKLAPSQRDGSTGRGDVGSNANKAGVGEESRSSRGSRRSSGESDRDIARQHGETAVLAAEVQLRPESVVEEVVAVIPKRRGRKPKIQVSVETPVIQKTLISSDKKTGKVSTGDATQVPVDKSVKDRSNDHRLGSVVVSKGRGRNKRG